MSCIDASLRALTDEILLTLQAGGPDRFERAKMLCRMARSVVEPGMEPRFIEEGELVFTLGDDGRPHLEDDSYAVRHRLAHFSV